jgi:hypothetical protein
MSLSHKDRLEIEKLLKDYKDRKAAKGRSPSVPRKPFRWRATTSCWILVEAERADVLRKIGEYVEDNPSYKGNDNG